MSKATELNQDGHENVTITNGSLIGNFETEEVEGEESDEYEEIDDDEEEKQVVGGEEEEEEDDDDEEDEHEGGEAEKGQNTLTHLLLGNTNGATVENEAELDEENEDEDDGDGEDDDEDEDEEYVDDDDGVYAAPPNPLNKKRSIDEVADGEASQGSKKIKA